MSDAIVSRPMVVRVNGKPLTLWTSCEVGRDLANIAGTFRIDYYDEGRADAALAMAQEVATIRENEAVEIKVAGVVVLRGWIDSLQLDIEADRVSASVSGRDVTGDLVDCHANPLGPGEYRMITLDKVVGSIAGPFGLSASVDVDVGAPFTLVAVETAEPAMATIEGLSRQRGVLVTSDGIGGIVLTQAGTTRAKTSLSMPGNCRRASYTAQPQQRFSDYWVKGAFNSLLRPSSATLGPGSSPASAPGAAPAAGPSFSATEAAAALRYGHSVDPDVRRWRPRVWQTKTQSGASAATQNSANPALDAASAGSTAVPGTASAAYHGHKRRAKRSRSALRTDASPWTLQDQADWRNRTARAHAIARVYTVPSLTDPDGALWLPNQLVTVSDRYTMVEGDMLIGAVTWAASGEHYETRISVVPPDCYDLTGDTEVGMRKGASVRAWAGTSR